MRIDHEPSIGLVLGSVVSSAAEGVRRNKISSALSLLALLIVIPLALGSRYDERPRYRRFILPEIERLEGLHLAALDRSADGPTDTWRLYHFLDAHRKSLDVLDYLRSRRTVTSDGTRAHGELIRYYELIDEHFAILRTQMSVHPNTDYLERWEEVVSGLGPIYRVWADWLDAPTS